MKIRHQSAADQPRVITAPSGISGGFAAGRAECESSSECTDGRNERPTDDRHRPAIVHGSMRDGMCHWSRVFLRFHAPKRAARTAKRADRRGEIRVCGPRRGRMPRERTSDYPFPSETERIEIRRRRASVLNLSRSRLNDAIASSHAVALGGCGMLRPVVIRPLRLVDVLRVPR